jgi:hypothetical protein
MQSSLDGARQAGIVHPDIYHALRGQSMRKFLTAFSLMMALCAPSLAAGNGAAASATPPDCTGAPTPALARPSSPVQLAQSSCRADCSSRRGYCVSSCRDSQCRAICNDIYQSCVSSCR